MFTRPAVFFAGLLIGFQRADAAQEVTFDQQLASAGVRLRDLSEVAAAGL
jgi:hypothetical protein